MSLPLVTIIIPCYNGRDYVGDAIRSALNQSYGSKEVIVIDDGSTDDSIAVIKQFGSAVKLFSSPHSGGSAARNTGLGLAKGDLIQFLDADDLLDAQKLVEQVRVLSMTNADVVYSDWLQYEFGRSKNRTIVRIPHGSGDLVILALQLVSIQTNSPIHRKDKLLAIGGFREDLPCCQERDLHLRLACSGASFHHLSKVLHTVRRRRGSVSSDELRVVFWKHTIALNAYKELSKRNAITEARRLAFAALIASQGRVMLRYGDRDRARECFQQARQIEPGGGLKGAYGRLSYCLASLIGSTAAEPILLRLGKARAALKSFAKRDLTKNELPETN